MRARPAVLLVLALVATVLAAAPARAAALRVEVVATGLDHPWEVAVLPTGDLLVTQRDRSRLTLVDPASGAKRDLAFPSAQVWTRGETGLLGLAVDPAFTANRRIYTCSGWRADDGSHDIRVNAWTLDAGLTAATLVGPLVTGLPPSRTGQHGGCRLLVAGDGSLLVGTGDAKRSRVPQDRRSLGGKVLRLDRLTGAPDPRNPWADRSGKRRYVLTWGHRNVQGLAQRADGSLWSVEHGTDRDDEVNLLRPGRNYGWNPGPGYDESRPMTDHRLPGRQYAARWRSGYPTIAPSGADFVAGPGWGRLEGCLAVAVLKGQRLMFVKLDDRGRVRWTRAPRSLRGHGRLRDVTAAPDGSLLLTTDNGGGRDVVLRVRPA
ncbi:PQQ-dependent sugar dehydrogenase [Nocardioides kongjuensis]|uniref:Glucose/arabinose dehydrogenase n=1 Tax=Nocardioides kongjuensis TaxID=349522 RepID=A0A852R6F8_9ACTN|nr:PQQ-dependent sugar dehydrogenase [Nocardioides kongjuensis]NYD29171.1 glucose/arabinose dehydrogenase [Nocardioides kongjuensis]